MKDQSRLSPVQTSPKMTKYFLKGQVTIRESRVLVLSILNTMGCVEGVKVSDFQAGSNISLWLA